MTMGIRPKSLAVVWLPADQYYFLNLSLCNAGMQAFNQADPDQLHVICMNSFEPFFYLAQIEGPETHIAS
jgi:hypothetical protein